MCVIFRGILFYYNANSFAICSVFQLIVGIKDPAKLGPLVIKPQGGLITLIFEKKQAKLAFLDKY